MSSKHEIVSIAKFGAMFMVVLVMIELLLGGSAQYIYFSQKSGKQARLIESIERENNGVLILGSSHANRHYVPSVFQDALGVDAYNAGVQGQKVLFASALLSVILKTSKPKLIILNIDDGWMEESPEAYDRLADLYPFYWNHRDALKPVLSLNLKFPDIQLMSAAYRLNSTVLHSIIYRVKPQKADNGYRPLNGQMDEQKHLDRLSDIETSSIEPEPKIDSAFVEALKDIIQTCEANKIPLATAISPRIDPPNEKTSASLEIMQRILMEKSIPILDHRTDTAFVGHYELFKDASHLNHKGATKYSAVIAKQVGSVVTE